jgi:hypothetical protein
MSTALPATDPSQHLVKLSSSTEKMRFFHRPSYLLLTTLITIFVSESIIMMFLKCLPPMTTLQETLLDALLLSVMVFPSLYYFVFKLLHQYIEQQQRAKEEKDTLIAELNSALNEVKTLRGIIPICASCKKIRDDNGFWQQVEVYVSAHSDVMFSHGCCPECAEIIIKSL